MNTKRKLLVAGAAAAALAAGGIGVAYGVGGESEEQASGPDAEKAKSAALEAVGGGTATEVERGDDGNAAFEVEIKRDDGSTVEVALDDQFRPIGSPESESGEEGESESGEDDDGPGRDDD